MVESVAAQLPPTRYNLPNRPRGYDFVGLVGEGAMARVYLVRCPDAAGTFFAMKVVCKADIAKRSKTEHIATERKVLLDCAGKGPASAFVLGLHASFETPYFCYMALDFCPGGDLFEVQSKHFAAQRIPEGAARFYLAEVVLGLECIHATGYVVRDMKPENILIGQDGHARISDFDLATPNGRGPKPEPHVGTQEYVPPEILKTVEALGYGETVCASSVGFAADVWVVGLMLFEMLHGYAACALRN